MLQNKTSHKIYQNQLFLQIIIDDVSPLQQLIDDIFIIYLNIISRTNCVFLMLSRENETNYVFLTINFIVSKKQIFGRFF